MANLVINNFQRGVSDSEFTGHSVIANLDVYSKKGIASLNFCSTATTGLTRFLRWGESNSGTIFGLQDNGELYSLNTTTGVWTLKPGNDVTGANGEGMATWKGYVFVARNAALDLMKISTSAWSNSWQTLQALGGTSGTNFHMMIAAQDDILYIGNGRYVASVMENVGQTFDPANAATYTVNLQALDLAAQYEITCLAELGNKLMIGTSNTNDNIATADIFPWDRSSASFDLPVRIGENRVNQMITRNNTLYATCGNYHTVYVTNGSSARKLKSVADLLREENSGSDYSEFTQLRWAIPGSICILGGKIYMGIKALDGSLDGLTNRYPIGVWSIDQSDNFSFEQEFSSLGNSFNSTFEVGALFDCRGGQILSMSLSANGSYNNDIVDMTGWPTRFLYTDYKGVIESKVYQVGTTLVPRTFQQIEFSLSKPLFSGQGIKLSYRTAVSDTWTSIGTFDYATYGSIMDFNYPFSVTANVIQIKIEITQSGTFSSPELIDVTLI